MTLVDGHPTILQAAGLAPLPDERPRPGRSWVDTATPPTTRSGAFAEYHAMGATSGAFMVRRGRFKLHYYVGFQPELFDLDADPEEATNLTDPNFESVLAELESALPRDHRSRGGRSPGEAGPGGAGRALRRTGPSGRPRHVAETPVPTDATKGI